MEITVSGRHTYVPEAFRATAEEKLSKIEVMAPKTQAIQVEVGHENNPKLAELRLKVEITIIGEGPVVRAEAAAADAASALDLAIEKLMERLRRLRDKSKDRRRAHDEKVAGEANAFDPAALEAELKKDAEARKAELKAEEQVSLGKKLASPDALESRLAPGESVEAYLDETSPVVIRKKVHNAERLSIEDAIQRMELLGHDFYLFIHTATDRPSAIYRRHGWSYGVIELA